MGKKKKWAANVIYTSKVNQISTSKKKHLLISHEGNYLRGCEANQLDPSKK